MTQSSSQTSVQTGSLQSLIAGASILFVDDESNILSSLKRLFRRAGYNKILTAPGGAEGLAILEQEPVDLIVSDMRMPEMDGAEFLEKAASKCPDTVRILLTGYADITSTINAINKGQIYKYVSKPWDDDDIKITVQKALELKFLQQEHNRLLKLTQKQNRELADLNNNLETRVKSRTEELGQAMAQLELTYDTLKNSYHDSIKVFSSLIEMRGGSLAGQSRRVAALSMKLAQKMGMSEDATQQVEIAGLLYQIGKIGLPDKLIKTPYNSLNTEEKRQYIKYPLMSEATLMALEPIQEAAKLIRHHHEQYDGNGYPDKLKGDDIPLGAKILAVVSDYVGIVKGTLTSKQLDNSEIRSFLWNNRNKRYDPLVVENFLKIISDELKCTKEKPISVMSSGLEEGMVLAMDIVSEEGVLLLAEGQELTEALIDRIHNFERSTEQDITIYIRKQGE